MAYMSKESGKSNFKPVPEGSHVARCVWVVDCGLQEVVWQQQHKWQEKCYINFEVPGFRIQRTDADGNEHDVPGTVGAYLTNSISDRSILGQFLVNWRGKGFSNDEKKGGFDLFNVLNVPALITVTHRESKGKTYANITGIMGLPAGMEAPERETPLLAYTPQDSEKKGNFDKLPQWLKDKCIVGHRMKDSPDHYPESKKEPETYSDTDFSDDIPFN